MSHSHKRQTSSSVRRIELLAPARDLAGGQAAILCGADAVYVGASAFSAREAAGNSMEDIERLVAFAHPYYARVYLAMNTLLFDQELEPAREIAWAAYEAGVDGLIIQDMGLLELALPPLALIASTQTHNHSPERVAFLESVGFCRAILARELTIEQICEISAQTGIELECFIHGALCVGTSGQCYMSYVLGGRSGNRGQCAQPCRREYSLEDDHGKVVGDKRYWLSLKDLNLSSHLGQLLDAGVSSFKIEGRLKDTAYVANVTGYYRRALDVALAERGMRKSSSGRVELCFEPDLAKTFNRGYSEYGIDGLRKGWGAIHSPKSIGEFMGVVKEARGRSFRLDRKADLHNGDGICYWNRDRQLDGTNVNRVEGDWVTPAESKGIMAGQEIYRNYNHEFEKHFKTSPASRKVSVELTLTRTDTGVTLAGEDEEGNRAEVALEMALEPARQPEAALKTIQTQLKKLGNTLFECQLLTVRMEPVCFFAVSVLNQLKRDWVERMLAARLGAYPRLEGKTVKSEAPYPEKRLSFRGNVINQKALAFYRRCGVETIDAGAETGEDLHGQVVMTTKYCILHEMGRCGGQRVEPAEPMILRDEAGQTFRVCFRCGECGMDIYWKEG